MSFRKGTAGGRRTALAFALLTLGMGLLRAGYRKREDYER
jgi:hypothetical protein